MVKVLSAGDLRSSERASRFEGRDHGSSVSFFWTRHPPGAGVDLHHHPYEETFVIQNGAATFTVDGDQVEAGDGVLHQVSIHPCDHVVQELLDGQG